MARTTAKQVLDRVDALLPNGYARAEKLRWLAQAEGFVLREIGHQTGELPDMTETTVLTAPGPVPGDGGTAGADRGDGADGGAAL